MKKYTALLLSLFIAFSLLTIFVYADTGNESGMQELVEVTWSGTVSGPLCDATVTLYKYQSAEPIDDEYQRMWGTFRLVVTDENGNVLIDEGFDTASKSISLTTPGNYYACVYTAKGDLQGKTGMNDGVISYEPLIQHFFVTEIYVPTLYEDLDFFFAMCCDDHPDDHDLAFREYLAVLHGIAASNDDFSLTEGAAYMLEALSNSEPKYAAMYEEFRANEGYAFMETASLVGHDPSILAEEETYGFWSGECWRYFANGLDFIAFDESGFMIPYAEYISLSSEYTEGSEQLNNESSIEPLIIVGAAAAAVGVCGVGTAVILTSRKKSK